MDEDEHDYVELMLDVKDGQIVGCEYFGEGRQVEPITKPVLLMRVGDVPWPRELARLERRVQRALSRPG